MKHILIYVVMGLIIGVIVTLLMYPSMSSKLTGVTYEKAMQSSDTLDAHFIEQMIPHHEDAITMAKLAQVKAKRPEVKNLAENIIVSQGKEISQMKQWYKNWFGKELPTDDNVMQNHGMMNKGSSMHMGMMGSDQDMATLKDAADFDRAFVEDMIPHHQMAVMMANMLENGTQRPEMKKLARDIISAQTTEIEQMRGWLDTWNK